MAYIRGRQNGEEDRREDVRRRDDIDLEKLKHLNAIVHAPVLREIDRQIQQQRSRDPQAVVLVESAVLFEASQHRRFDKIIVVWCTPEQQVERYISQHSDARFSHGFCPECLERHYPKEDPEE